jgi:chemotaxis protein MotA
MAVAIITTFYGALTAFLVCGPIAAKLELRSNEENLVRQMMIKGVMSIQSGDNPRIVEQKLKIYMPPALRDKLESPPAA